MYSMFRKSSHTKHEHWNGHHRSEHWYRDNTVYFITSRVREGFAAFATEACRAIFWDRFHFYTQMHGFFPWARTLMNNHYHFVGYLRDGEQLGEMMRKLHGSVAWLVMKELGIKHVPFWREKGNKDYFDGCLRDVLQGYRATNYTLMQAVRARLVTDWRDYPDTFLDLNIDRAIARGVELNAFLEDVPYARYERHKKKRGHRR